MTRRKRNTWQPNEITSIIRSSQDSLPDSRPSGDSFSSSQQSLSDEIPQVWGDELGDESDAGKDARDIIHSDSKEGAPNAAHLDQSDQLGTRSPGNDHSNGGDRNDAESGRGEQKQDDASRLNIAEGSDKQSSVASSYPNDAHNVSEQVTEQRIATSTPSRKFRRTSSMVRLSMSLDGKASVVLKGSTPSPPSKQPVSMPTVRSTLQRSRSLVSGGLQQISALGDARPFMPIPRTHGRSQDARTWEFYCDSDVRESLTKTAENDQRGSAAGPIHLIRSGSASRQPLSASTTKQNAQIHRQGSSKRKAATDQQSSKPKLARTASSYARLQSTTAAQLPKPSSRGDKPSTQPALFKDASGDSDKENWEPGSQSGQRNRPSRMHPPRAANRKVLQENDSLPSHSSSLGALMEREKVHSRHAESRSVKGLNCNAENAPVDKEVSNFMRGSSQRGGEEDLDVVQSLLSLSQGAWD